MHQETTAEDGSTMKQAQWQSALHRGLILPVSTISLETYDFKHFPQISINNKVYRSG